jgi:hypothetical protein
MLRRAAAVSLAVLAGCQDYNFNPVGKCVIQPGVTRLKVDRVSTADLLFVVDESGSMRSQQESLARNFRFFIDELANTQRDRTTRGLDPLDIHVAITTSSIYENVPTGGTCGGAGPVCEYRSVVDQTPQSYSCAPAGDACGEVVQRYWDFAGRSGCAPGAGVEGRPYPAGDFVAAPGNPRVLHFTKDLNWASWGTASVDPRLTDLVASFQQNILVGTCGSGQEQHFQGSRLAIEKALRVGGKSQPADIAPGEFPHEGGKLVVVYVGDEDDCSGPTDPNLAIINSTFDACDRAASDPAAPRKQFAVTDYANFLLGLGRPLGAGFIYSANCTVVNGQRVCTPGECRCAPPTGADCLTCPVPGDCASCPPVDQTTCSGKSAGTRMKQLASLLSDGGVPVVEGSVCEYSFATSLRGIAELVKPPTSLRLASQPASGEVAILRIVGQDGSSRTCKGPGPDADWWFVDCNDPALAPKTGATSCIAIRSESACEARSGETYTAEYLGLVPASGCGTAALQSSECAQLLGGRAQDWSCDIAAGQTRGSCLCNASN